MALTGDDAASSLLRTSYGLTSLDPVGGAALRRQSAVLGQKFIDRVAERSTPQGLGLAAPKLTLDASATSGAANKLATRPIEQAISKLTSSFNRARVDMGGAYWAQTVRRGLNAIDKSGNTKLAAEVAKIIDDTMPIGPRNTVTLQQVSKAMAELRQLRNTYGGGQAAGAGQLIDDLLLKFEELGRKRLSAGPTFGVRAGALQAWDTWTQMIRSGDLWKWNNLLRGIDNQGMITPSSLYSGLDAAKKTFLGGGVPNEKLLSLGKQVMENDAAHVMGAFGTKVAAGPAGVVIPALGATGGAVVGGPWGAVAGASILPLLSRVGVQRFLTGQQQWQRILSQYLRNNPQLLSRYAGRAAVAAVPNSEAVNDGTVR
jgi:hypothetical protein